MNLKVHIWAGPWKGVCGIYAMEAARLARPHQWDQVPEHLRCLRCEKHDAKATE